MSMPLGTLRSWMRDALLTGALLPPCGLLAVLLVIQLIEGTGSMQLDDFFCAVLASCLTGAVLAAGTAPVAWWLASATWRTPLLALSLGPGVGALVTWWTVELVALLVDGRRANFRWDELVLLLGFGAFAVGPPWVAYVSVRARGRPGLPVVGAAAVWVAGTAATLVLLAWVRRFWLRGW